MKDTLIQVKIDNFQGPLDLLLHLIEKKEMKINEINISKIIDDYLEYIREQKNLMLKIKVDFLILATELVEIKAYSILDKKKNEEKLEDLERRIVEYKFFKDISTLFSNCEKEYNIPYKYNGDGVVMQENIEYDFSQLTKEEIYNSFKKLMEFNNKKSIKMNIELMEVFSTEEAINEIMNTFKDNNGNNILYNNIFSEDFSKEKIVSIFLAILELIKISKIDILLIDEKIYLKNINLY